MQYDALIVGAGFASTVAARQLAEGGSRALVMERRNHVGGNAFDCLDHAGVLIHQYEPHIFSHKQQAGLRLSVPIYEMAQLLP